MPIIRTGFWVLLTAALVAFIAINWTMVQVNFWPMGDAYLHFDWPVGLVALFFFLVGLVPMWVLHRVHRWGSSRRINALESALRAAAPAPPLATSTQLESAAQD